MIKTCQFGTLEDSLLRDKIVLGIRDANTRKKLLQDPALTLKQCIDVCRINEKSISQLKTLEDVHFVRGKGRKQGYPSQKKVASRQSQPSHTTQSQYSECSSCGFEHDSNKQSCPAFGRKCAKCGDLHHFARKCRKTKPQSQKHAPNDNPNYQNYKGGARLKQKTLRKVMKNTYSLLREINKM
jgi:hypothetical protein